MICVRLIASRIDAIRLSHKGMVLSLASIRLELLCLFAFCVGCGQPTIPASEHSPVVPQTSQPAAEPNIMPPRYSSVQVFINDHQFGDDGCTSTFSPTAAPSNARIEHGATCGSSDAASKVTWSYLHSDKNGDHYHFKRVFPYRQPGQETSEIDVAFKGDDLVVFKDTVQRIVLRTAREQPGSGASVTTK
jgi:hypothetical protein